MSKKQIKGKVIFTNNQNTAKVLTSRYKTHPKYHKKYEVSKKYLVVNPNNKYKIDQQVLIEEIKPVSKNKYFRIIKEIK
jgi:small subunit ribosomal protein S17